MSVVLAGGGTAGHIEPALAVADALRRIDPRIPLTCLGTERGLETRLVPLRGYDLALIPPVPLPRRAEHGTAQRAGTAGPRGPRRRGRAGPDQGAGRRRFRRLRGHARVPGGAAPPGAHRGPRRERQGGPGEPHRRAVHPARVHRPPRHQAAARHLRRDPDPQGDLRAEPAGPGGQGARALRAAARPARAAGHRRLTGRQVAQPGGARRRGRDPRRRRPGAAPARPAQRPGGAHVPRPGRPTSRCPMWTGWTWPTPRRTSRCAAAAR